MQTTLKYYANGKILLTGEYLVLFGAKSLALPLKVGQSLKITNHNAGNTIVWNAYFQDKLWFSCEFNRNFEILKSSNFEKAATLVSIFENIKKLKPDFIVPQGNLFETHLDTNPEWGFGSSSTLISLLSQYSKVDAYKLNDLTFNGSGFDIACATANGPIIYTRQQPTIPIELNYSFSANLYLVYSGKKLATNPEVKNFIKTYVPDKKLISKVNGLTAEFANCNEYDTFNILVSEHEKLIGEILQQTPVKQKHFADFEGEIKSLGAWGGDFYLVSSQIPYNELRNYFELKGLNCVLKFNDLVLGDYKNNE